MQLYAEGILMYVKSIGESRATVWLTCSRGAFEGRFTQDFVGLDRSGVPTLAQAAIARRLIGSERLGYADRDAAAFPGGCERAGLSKVFPVGE
jgi:hypothetical protein